MSLSKLAQDFWILQELDGNRVQMTNRIGQGQWTVNKKQVKKMVKILSPDSIQQTLGIHGECSCVHQENLSKCPQKFTWAQIWKLRGDFHSKFNL